MNADLQSVACLRFVQFSTNSLNMNRLTLSSLRQITYVAHIVFGIEVSMKICRICNVIFNYTTVISCDVAFHCRTFLTVLH